MCPFRILHACILAGVLPGLNAFAAAIVQFDIDDNVGPSPTEPGWVRVTGSADNADTLSGTDGVRTLVLSHLVPGDLESTEGEWEARVRPHFAGELACGVDLDEYALGAG